MNTRELANNLYAKSLTDFFLTGFVDLEETPAGFHPIVDYIYLEFDDRLLEIAAFETTGTMLLRFCEGVQHRFDAEGFVLAQSSIRDLVLLDPSGSNAVHSITLWSSVDAGEEGIRCAAVRFRLENGQEIFVDPTNHFGLRWGGAEQEQRWLTDWLGSETAVVETLDVRLA